MKKVERVEIQKCWIGCYQADSITQAKAWLKNNLAHATVIDTQTANNKTEYLALVNELNACTPVIPTIVLSDTDSLNNRLLKAERFSLES